MARNSMFVKVSGFFLLAAACLSVSVAHARQIIVNEADLKNSLGSRITVESRAGANIENFDIENGATRTTPGWNLTITSITIHIDGGTRRCEFRPAGGTKNVEGSEVIIMQGDNSAKDTVVELLVNNEGAATAQCK